MSVFDNYQCEGQLTLGEIYGQDIWSGKTCPERSVQTKERTLDVSLKKRSASSKKMPLFLDLRGGRSGVLQAQSWEMGGLLLGEFTMHSFGECPKEERESRLSQILEDHPHLKYCLSARACQGILNRAEKRGKELPEMLKMTLLKQSAFKSEQENPGGGKGILIQNERTGALSTLNNQSVCYGLCSMNSNSMKSSNPHSGIYEADTSRTLDLNGGNSVCNQGGMAIVQGVDAYNQTITGDKAMSITGAATDPHHIPCVTVSQDAYDKFSENEKSASLKASGGTYGGGSEALVIQ